MINNNNEYMRNICLFCYYEPKSHSFTKMDESNNIITYYTCPSKAKLYNDNEGIIIHYDNELSRLGEKKWKWIFDGKDFSIKHSMNISLAIQLSKLIINKYSKKLLQIKIINTNIFIKSILNIVWLILDNKTRQKIIIE